MPTDHETDSHAELDAIRAAFPTLSWDSAQRIDEGWDHVVVICRGCSEVDALGHTDLVFRFPTDSQALAQLPREIVVLEHAATCVDSAIPRYTHVPDGVEFAGYPLVRGERLTPEVLHSLPATDKTTIAGQLGALLATLHGMDTTAPPLDLIPHSYQPENLDFVRGIMENDLPARFTDDEMRTAREICDEVAALQSTLLPRVFLHNDVNVRHLYWDAGPGPRPGRLGLIDFTDMCLGDPAVDFAELYGYGPRFVDEVLAHYVGRIDDAFLDRAWTYQRLAGLYEIAGHLYYGEETWEYARATFDRCRSPRRPRS
ncbi:aminoglycoside phosphotransferase family protein [Rhodococcus sp. IEGM 1408]|uniref:aminoglycoside phosphotransferase family protein n=1 Tax=Rhodococcus sp. IEGM 1408 TaxID=3082220 RepID=UPI002954A985|nr:aminoglycoside phosphotransferase family protein [Rhodococcus sp. IEGM 1408]MDV8002348.1 aminoglycoside phosphotransferase family protein [Rhodococcus sp. IEGM 1408]